MNYEILLTIIAAAVCISAIARVIWKELRHAFNVPEGWAGLQVLPRLCNVRWRNNAGRHVIWGYGWTVQLMDLRKTSLLVAGQEVLTADNVSLKLSLIVTCRIADPAKAAHETQNWLADLHHTVHLAARSVVGGVPVDTLVNQRLEMGAQLLARAQPEAANSGINILAIEVKDVMIPVELQRAFTRVVKTKQDGQAALERARGESAARKGAVDFVRE